MEPNNYQHFQINEPVETWRINSHGMNFVDLDGWTRMIPQSFTTTIVPSTRWKEINMNEAQNKLSVDPSQNVTLEYLTGASGMACGNCLVHVLAKKSVDLVVTNYRVMIICTLVVGDDSGYAILSSMNEGYQCVYSTVKVGDCLLLTHTFPQTAKTDSYKGLFTNEMCLNLELKYQFYHVRQHYKIALDMTKLQHYIFPKKLLDTIKIFLPSDLQSLSQKSDQELSYFDLVGVVCYVGRMERVCVNDNLQVMYKKPGEVTPGGIPVTENRPFCKYVMHRWIQMIDKTSNIPIRYKLHINNTNIDIQKDLIPGSIIILTHSKIEDRYAFPSNYVCSSSFTELVIGADLVKYYGLRKTESIFGKLSQILAMENYTNILQNPQNTWSCGGSLQFTLRTKLSPSYNFKPLERRASVLQFIHGRIISAVQVDENKSLKVIYLKEKIDEPKQCIVDKYVPGQMPFSFIYKLPPPWKKEYSNLKKTREIVGRVAKEYSKFCEPLLLPSPGEITSLIGLPTMNGYPYFVIHIQDIHRNAVHACIYKVLNFSLDDTILKINNAKSNVVCAVIEEFMIEKNFDKEICLHDFILVE